MENAPPSVIVPVYNEEHGVEAVLESLLDALQGEPRPWEVIVVDDGSTDGTPDILKRWENRVQVVRHRVNRGYGASLKTGIRSCHGPWIAIVDGDGTYPLERLPELYEVCRQGADMAVGARTAPGAKIPLIRRPAKWILTRLASYLAASSIPDLNSGMRVFARDRLERHLHLLPDTFSFTTTLTLAFITDGYDVAFVPIDYKVRKGRSKLRPIRDTYNFVLLILRTVIFFDPLRVFGPLGLLFMSTSFAMVLYRALVDRAFGVVSVLFFVTGIQLLALGLLGDLINRRGLMLTRNRAEKGDQDEGSGHPADRERSSG